MGRDTAGLPLHLLGGVGVRDVVLEYLEEPRSSPRARETRRLPQTHNEASERAKQLGQPRHSGAPEDDERYQRSDGDERDAQLEEQRGRERDTAPAETPPHPEPGGERRDGEPAEHR